MNAFYKQTFNNHGVFSELSWLYESNMIVEMFIQPSTSFCMKKSGFTNLIKNDVQLK